MPEKNSVAQRNEHMPEKITKEGSEWRTYTERYCTIDFSQCDKDKEIAIVIQQNLPIDSLFGVFNPQDSSFTIKTLGETYYKVFLKNIGKEYPEGESDDQYAYASKRIEMITFYLGNMIINFKKTPSHGYYTYNIIHNIPIVTLVSGEEKAIGEDYGYQLIDVGNIDDSNLSEEQLLDKLLAQMGSSKLNVSVTYYDSNHNSITTNTGSFTKDEVKNNWNTQGYIFRYELPAGTDHVLYSAKIGDNDTTEYAKCKHFPKNQHIDLTEKYDMLRHPAVMINLTNNTNQFVLNAAQKSDMTLPVSYKTTIMAGEYNLSLLLSERFGLPIMSQMLAVLYGQLEGLSKTDLLNKSKSMSFTLRSASNPAISQKFSLDASILFSGEKSALQLIKINQNIPQAELYYNFNNYNGILSNDLNGIEHYVWNYLHSDLGRLMAIFIDKIYLQTNANYASDIAPLKSYFGPMYFFVLLFNPTVLEFFTKTGFGSDTYKTLVTPLMGNMDILASRSSNYWYKIDGMAESGTKFFEILTQYVNDLLAYSDKHDLSIADMLASHDSYSIAEVKNLVYHCYYLFGGTWFPPQEEANSSKSIAVNYDTVKSALTDLKDLFTNTLQLSQKDMGTYLDKMASSLRQHVRPDRLTSEESTLGALDVLFTPKERQADNYNTDLILQNLEMPSYGIDNSYYYNNYDFIMEGQASEDGENKTWQFDLIELDRHDIKEFILEQQVIFATEQAVTDKNPTLTLSYRDNNGNELASRTIKSNIQLYEGDNITVFDSFSSIEIDNVENINVYRLAYTYQGDITFASVKATSLVIGIPDVLATAAQKALIKSTLYYNKQEEKVQGTGFAYEGSIPADWLTAKDNIRNKLAYYTSIPINFTQLTGSIVLSYDVLFPGYLANDAAQMFLALYSSSGQLVQQYKIDNKVATPKESNTVRGEWEIEDYLGKDIFEVVFMAFTTNTAIRATSAKLGVAMTAFSHKILYTYTPSIYGDQEYTTAIYQSNAIIVQEGTTLIHNNPGYNTFILNRSSQTTLELMNKESILNNITFTLSEADSSSVVFTRPESSDDLLISWKYKPEDDRSKRSLRKQLQKLFFRRRTGVLAGKEESSLTIKDYFTTVAVGNITLAIDKDTYTIESDTDGSEIFLRKILRLDNLDDNEEPVYTAHNYIVGKPGAVVVPSPEGEDIIVGTSDPQTTLVNSASGKNTHMIGGQNYNIFDFIYTGDGYISANGKQNVINIENKVGQKIIDVGNSALNRISVNMSNASYASFFIADKNLVYASEVLPPAFDVNLYPGQPDNISRYRSSFTRNIDSIFVFQLKLFAKPAEAIVLLSTIVTDADDKKQGMELVVEMHDSFENYITFKLMYYADGAMRENPVSSPILYTDNEDYVVQCGISDKQLFLDVITADHISTMQGIADYTGFPASKDLSFAVNYRRTDDKLTAGNQRFSMPFFCELLPEVTDDLSSVQKELSPEQMLALRNYLVEGTTEDVDLSFLSRLSSLTPHSADEKIYNIVYFINLLKAEPAVLKNTLITVNEGCFTAADLIWQARMNEASISGLNYLTKDKNEPKYQKNFTTMLNIEHVANLEKNSDRIGFTPLYLNNDEA